MPRSPSSGTAGPGPTRTGPTCSGPCATSSRPGWTTRPLAQPRDNQATYFRACTRLNAIYKAYLAGKTTLPEEGHLPFRPASEREIKAILAEEGTGEERSRRWVRGIESGLLFQPDTADIGLEYSTRNWDVEAMTGTPLAVTTPAYQFNRAARHYLEAMHDDILPSMDILVR